MSDQAPVNDGQQLDRLPPTAADRAVAGRPTREEVIRWWNNRFEVPPTTWDNHTFWEKGKGKIWAVAAEYVSPIAIEGLGLRILRTRQEHWKPSTNAVQRFGVHATKNVVSLNHDEAIQFADGTDQPLPRWDGDWGYLIVAHEIAGDIEPIGVGLYLHDELRSTVPKGRREDLS
ncbi:hypothetical protein [Haloquadratum walsbyi]|jgi:hypothetical protein|uniref:DUF7122 domain-containing protein n=1 Tax=Haloquadratum walsbyi J07HQW2 TaxID=1238425 RepID=U1MWK3_9EURY|nr:hypothetical protein [Haloquadratum walsbyi]ERG94824.1 MAG: hypothetical protein J07HQW2_01266 [Haloquadratum walsbyi J07HQW2]